MSLRLWISVQISRLARALDFIAIAFMRREDLVAWNGKRFEHLAKKRWAKNFALFELHEAEKLAVESLSVGKALVLGAGEGREAIALAKRGWEVTALEYSPLILERAKRNAVEHRVSIEWIQGDASQPWSLQTTFDVICLFGQFYHYIPSQEWRHDFRNRLKAALKQNGKILMSLPVVQAHGKGRQRAHQIRLFFSKLFFANPHLEVGDTWSVHSEYYHYFESFEEFASEWHRAGFSLDKVTANAESEMLIAHESRNQTSRSPQTV